MLLEYVLDEPLSHCLAIERSRTRIFTLPGRSQIEKQVNQVAESLKKQGKNEEAAAVQKRFAKAWAGADVKIAASS